MEIRKAIFNGITRWWWILLEVLVSTLIALFGPFLLSPFMRTGIDMDNLMLRVGSDALTLMGFTITSLAIIARHVDRRIFDEVREQTPFRDLWGTFGLTACMLGSLTLLIRLSYVFVTPEWLLQVLGFLLVFNILLVTDCIVLLVAVVSLINRDIIKEKRQAEPVEPEFSD